MAVSPTTGARQMKWEGVAVPRESETAQKRTEGHAEDSAEKSGDETPVAHNVDGMRHTLFIAGIEILRNALHGTHGQTEIGRVADKLYGGIEQRDKAHALRTEEDGNKLVADNAYKYAEALHTAEKTGVLKDMGIAVGAFFF